MPSKLNTKIILIMPIFICLIMGWIMSENPKKSKCNKKKNILVAGDSRLGMTRFYIKPYFMECESMDCPVSFTVTVPGKRIEYN